MGYFDLSPLGGPRSARATFIQGPAVGQDAFLSRGYRVRVARCHARSGAAVPAVPLAVASMSGGLNPAAALGRASDFCTRNPITKNQSANIDVPNRPHPVS